MTQQTESRTKKEKPAASRFSLDVWAVTLALVLSLLVWIGWLKHIPW
ncbi:MAG TPA: hypothetical protein VEX69_01545 [Candidatus Limnocylindria bacterium]|nr:hypothetical protein [Candidatus Limnocylindria bacterium]